MPLDFLCYVRIYNIESIKEQGLLKDWERARLLDGWICGPRYNFEMGNNFRSCMGYMLVIQVHAPGSYGFGDSENELYADVTLSDKGKQVALLLCGEDWNYELEYWILNSLAKKDTMDPRDVRGGSIPLSNASAVEDIIELNSRINGLVRSLGREIPASHKVGNMKLTPQSAMEVFVSMVTSCVEQLPEAHKKLLGRSFFETVDIIAQHICEQSFEVDWSHDFESNRSVVDVMWNLMWEHVLLSIIRDYASSSLRIIIEKWADDKSQPTTGGQRNFILYTCILYYLADVDIIYEVRGKDFEGIIREAYEHAAGDGQRFKDMLQNERMRICDFNENYNVVDMVLHNASIYRDLIIMNKMLDCGAHALSINHYQQTAVHLVVLRFDDGDKIEELLRSLFDNCHAKEQLANARDDDGQTALHWASRVGKARACKLLLQYGARPDAQDNRGRVPLHYAVEAGEDAVIDVLIGKGNTDAMQSQHLSDDFNQKRIQMLNSKNNDGKTPLDLVAAQNNIKLMAKLLPTLEQSPESYFDKMERGKLLRQFAFEGNTDIVGKLLKRGTNPLDADEEGKTALHYAAMCENQHKAEKTVDLLLRESKEKETLTAKRDGRGRTALHLAALQGNVSVIWSLGDLINIKDADARIPLYNAVKTKHDKTDIIENLIHLMGHKGIHLVDLIDSTGATPLHMAASQGKLHQVDALLSRSKCAKIYVKKADYLGQTALHKAAKGGHLNTIKVLLHWGARPLLERDCDGRTALHYAVQSTTGEDGVQMAQLLLKKCKSDEEKLLFLWASAAGLGTADQNLNESPLKKFLLDQKKELAEKAETNNLLRTAACLGDTEMTKELLTRGGQIADIRHQQWREGLQPKERQNVNKVLKQIQTIAEQGNDQPAVLDNLGRADYAYGLAALLLNPYLKPPIAVGISGSWGMGKSSLMIQTEIILLKTAAELALLPSKSALNFPGLQIVELSGKGKKKIEEIKRWVRSITKNVDSVTKDSEICMNFFVIRVEEFQKGITNLYKRIQTWIFKKNEEMDRRDGNTLVEFLNNYEVKYHNVFKSLAAMDTSDMYTPEGQQLDSRIDTSTEGSVPAVLTVKYNAWKYRNESEALAGMAVEVTKEMEGIMTDAQWLSTCWRNTWRKQKQKIWIEVIFPCLLAVFLAASFTWIVWMLLDRYKIKESLQLKYASLPATIVIIVWTLVKSVMSTVNPVSAQLMNYIKFPDHSEKLGYQERVISDITFLKEEIVKKPYWLSTVAIQIWHLITYIISLLCPKWVRATAIIPKAPSGLNVSSNLRIIVFVDDLDRCQESVILQVLSAINLVLAVCEISVVVGMDKALIQRAILKKYGDKSLKSNQSLADKYLQKIIQLPLDLPDPSEDESRCFLERQLGVFQKENRDENPDSEENALDNSKTEIDTDYEALFSIFDRRQGFHSTYADVCEKLGSVETSMPLAGSSSSGEASEPAQRKGEAKDVTIDVHISNRTNFTGSRKTEVPPETDATRGANDGQILIELIPIREMLFVRYSEGEREAFCYFLKMATDCRKFPREWKRLLNYHRLVWLIFFISNRAQSLAGWQVQLITWIFICWEWEENMDIIIKNWNTIGVLKSSESVSQSDSSGPSLRMIVDHFIKNESRIMFENKEENTIVDNKDKKLPATGDDEVQTSQMFEDSEQEEMKTEKLEEQLKEKGVRKKTKDPESSNSEPVQFEEMAKVPYPIEEGDMTKFLEHSENKETAYETLEECMKEDVSMSVLEHESSNKVCEKSKDVDKAKMVTMTEVERDISKPRDCCESSIRAMGEKLDEVEKTLRKEVEKTLRNEMDELKKEIKELKEMNQRAGKNKKSAEEKKLKLKNWRRMKSVLNRYDVSMDGIKAFQRFRFYCEAGYLPWPLPIEEIEE